MTITSRNRKSGLRYPCTGRVPEHSKSQLSMKRNESAVRSNSALIFTAELFNVINGETADLRSQPVSLVSCVVGSKVAQASPGVRYRQCRSLCDFLKRMGASHFVHSQS